MPIVLGPNERYLGKKITSFGYECFIGQIGKRGATRSVCTDLLGNELKEVKNVAKPTIENIKANFLLKAM